MQRGICISPPLYFWATILKDNYCSDDAVLFLLYQVIHSIFPYLLENFLYIPPNTQMNWSGILLNASQNTLYSPQPWYLFYNFLENGLEVFIDAQVESTRVAYWNIKLLFFIFILNCYRLIFWIANN